MTRLCPITANRRSTAGQPRRDSAFRTSENTRPGRTRAGDQDMRTLHVRCGSDIRRGLTSAGLRGEFLAFTDPFCIGPVPAVPIQQLMPVRADFLATQPGIQRADILAHQQQEYGALGGLNGYERVVLWFEHDSYDQLILAYLLSRLADQRRSYRLELIAVDSIPGVERFVGLGQLDADLLAWLWTRRLPVSPELLATGTEAWAAITAPDPTALDALARAGTPALPMLARALHRHLKQLPALDTGLGLTERLALEALRESGPTSTTDLFAELMDHREPLPYLGDLMFWWLLQPLIRNERPLLTATGGNGWRQQQLALTADGHAVLDGKTNWLDLNPPERWVGGVRIPGDGTGWCYDAGTDSVTMRRGAPA